MRGALLRGADLRGGDPLFTEAEAESLSVATYVFNTSTLGITQFSGDEWDGVLGIGEISGKRLMVTADGLYEVTGSDAVTGSIKTGKIFLVNGALFNLYRVDTILKADNPVSVTLYSEYNGVESIHGPYTQDPEGRAEFRKWKFKAARGPRGTSWAIEISCAGQWECRGLQMHVAIYQKRRR